MEMILRRYGFSATEAREFEATGLMAIRAPVRPSWQLPTVGMLAFSQLVPLPFDDQPLLQFATMIPVVLALSLLGVWYERRSLNWSYLVIVYELVQILIRCSISVQYEQRRGKTVRGVELARVVHRRRRYLRRASRRIIAASAYLGTGDRSASSQAKSAGCGVFIRWAAAAPWDDSRRGQMLDACVRQLRYVHGDCVHVPYVEYPPGVGSSVFATTGRQWIVTTLAVLRLPLVVAVVGAFVTAVLRLFF